MPLNASSSAKFAILKRTTQLILVNRNYANSIYHNSNNQLEGAKLVKNHDHKILNINEEDNNNNSLHIEVGALLKIFDSKNKLCQEDDIIVQILDYVNHLIIYENLYICKKRDILIVDDGLWPFIISIVEGERRLLLAQDVEHCKWLRSLNLNDIVSVQGEMFQQTSTHYDCIIRYIGPVIELYPVGYFFGLEILDLNNGRLPQMYEYTFCHNYLNCDSDHSIFATGNWIRPLLKDCKKFSPRHFLVQTLEKVRTVIVPIQSNGESTSPMRKVRKSKELPSAQFYADLVADMDTQLNLQDNEEFQKSIENYEKTIERRSTIDKVIPQNKTVTMQSQTPASILKTKRSSIAGTSSTTKDYNRKSTISGLIPFGDKDILIIDNDEIQETTKRGADIIVVDKAAQDGVDLAELLGANWPKTAGDAAIILNQKLNTSEKSNSNHKNKLSQANLKQSNIKNAICQHSFDDGKSQELKQTDVPTVINENVAICPDEQRENMTPVILFDVPNSDLGVGSMVEVNVPDMPQHLYGVIRWVGVMPGNGNNRTVEVGVELEDDYHDKKLSTTDGRYNNIQLFKCPEGRGIFVLAKHCKRDRRFTLTESDTKDTPDEIDNISNLEESKTMMLNGNNITFGNVECPIIHGTIPPIKCLSLNELEELCGKFKGIQGHHNSCYLDVTLFSMFAFTPVFDAILFRPPEAQDISHYLEVQTVLREEIVNPLRKHMFVRADRVMKLRQLLDKLSSVSGLTSEEKDPEEFLNCILSQIFKADPFLKLSSEQDAYYYQLFVEKDERLSFPSVQQLFEQSFYTSDIKLKEVPSCLIIQMPRFGKNYKMYSRILPSQVLDITDIIEDSPRQCSVCGVLAECECRDCYDVLQTGSGLESTAFCAKCIDTAHMHSKRINHVPRKLSVPQDFRAMAEHMTVPRLYMELFAVVCIETSHYVTFLKAGSGPDAPWCFFDSMADRKGELNGYNIPEIKTVPDLPRWLSDDGARFINETFASDKLLPEHAKRLFCDAYMCMYQSTDVMMYR